MPAVPAASTGETMGQDAAFEVAAKLPLHGVCGTPPLASCPSRAALQIGLQMRLHRVVQRRALGATAAIEGARPETSTASLPTQTSPSCRRNDRIMIGEVIGKHFPAGQRPAHTLVGIGALALEDLLIEVEAMAVVED